MADPILVKISEAEIALGTSTRTIYALIAAGRLEAVKHGRSTRIVYESLKRYAAGCEKLKTKMDDRARHFVEAAA
jgi:excisionase family DNA binding protein